MTRDEQAARDITRIATLNRKVSKLEAERDWAENERKITNEWAQKAWEEVRWLRDLLEKALSGTHPLQVQHNDGSGGEE